MCEFSPCVSSEQSDTTLCCWDSFVSLTHCRESLACKIRRCGAAHSHHSITACTYPDTAAIVWWLQLDVLKSPFQDHNRPGSTTMWRDQWFVTNHHLNWIQNWVALINNPPYNYIRSSSNNIFWLIVFDNHSCSFKVNAWQSMTLSQKKNSRSFLNLFKPMLWHLILYSY